MKTLLFSASNAFVFRNYIYFPKSTLLKLNDKKNINLIVVINSNILDEFSEIITFLNSNSIKYEKINYIQKSGLLSKVFKFFYTFLVFTNTTKIVSTKGTRLDLGRGKERRKKLVLLKIILNKIFGSQRWIKRWLVPKLYLILFNNQSFKELLDKYQPDLLFLPNIGQDIDLNLLAESKRRGIKTISSVSSWDNFNKYFIPLRVDHLQVWNDPMKEEAIKFEAYKKEEVEITGVPHFDYYMDKKIILPRKKFLEKINFPYDAKIIFFASEGIYYPEGNEIVDMILNRINSEKDLSKCRVIIKPYPTRKNNNYEKKNYLKFKRNPLVNYFEIHTCKSRQAFTEFINVLYHSDIIISIYSSITLEASVFNKPLVNIGFDGYQNKPSDTSVARLEKLSHFIHMTETGAVKTVKSKEELFRVINEYLQNPDKDNQFRQILRDKMCYKLDGLTSERIANSILRIANI